MSSMLKRLFRREPELRGRPLRLWLSDTKDPSPHVRIRAARVLGEAGDEAHAVVPGLIRVLSDRQFVWAAVTGKVAVLP